MECYCVMQCYTVWCSVTSCDGVLHWCSVTLCDAVLHWCSVTSCDAVLHCVMQCYMLRWAECSSNLYTWPSFLESRFTNLQSCVTDSGDTISMTLCCTGPVHWNSSPVPSVMVRSLYVVRRQSTTTISPTVTYAQEWSMDCKGTVMAKTFERTILIQCPFSRIIRYIQWVG